jgi:hypothetical protein
MYIHELKVVVVVVIPRVQVASRTGSPARRRERCMEEECMVHSSLSYCTGLDCTIETYDGCCRPLWWEDLNLPADVFPAGLEKSTWVPTR